MGQKEKGPELPPARKLFVFKVFVDKTYDYDDSPYS